MTCSQPTPVVEASAGRRSFHRAAGAALLGSLCLATWQRALALNLADLSNADASSGVKAALEKGALAALDLLGRNDGFLGNPKVRIPLPGPLEQAAQLLRGLGQGQKVDDLVTAMNRAAEAAVPLGKDVLLAAVRGMTVSDAKAIIGGGDRSVTQFFASKTREPLGVKFLPIVKTTTEKVSLAQRYNDVAGRAARMGLLKADDADLPHYVTGKTLDGLYTIIGDEEQKIRQNPMAAGSQILQKVFGATP